MFIALINLFRLVLCVCMFVYVLSLVYVCRICVEAIG